MDNSLFWTLVDDIRSRGEGERDRMEQDLRSRLRSMPPNEIVDFVRIYRDTMNRANHWNVLGAALIIGCGQSEDGFADFRSWLIFQGKEAFEGVLHNPDTLADFSGDDPIEEWYFEIDYVPALVFKEVTGRDLEPGENETMVAGEPIELEEELEGRFPLLWKRLRQPPRVNPS